MILITGSSGQLASQIARQASAAGLDLRTASRAPDADRQMDFDHPETLDFSGVDTLFLTSAGYAEDDVVIRRHGAVVEAARAQGVGHVIYSSLHASGVHLGFALAHRWTERALQASGMKWTILRNGLYAELVGALVAPRGGKITTPFGNGGISAVARNDLAAAAVSVLKAPDAHVGRSYELAGTAAISAAEIAGTLGVPYVPNTFEAERELLGQMPLLPFQAPMLMSIASAATAGYLAVETTDLVDLVAEPQDALTIASAVAQAMAQP
mgnify:CR=1 FL=1